MELGGIADGLAACEEMGSRADAMGDALAEAAYLASVCGDVALAQSLLARLERGDAVEVGDPVARYQAVLASVA